MERKCPKLLELETFDPLIYFLRRDNQVSFESVKGVSDVLKNLLSNLSLRGI